jgi:hypothetical protein
MAFAATRRGCQRFWHNPTAVHFAPWGDYEQVIQSVVAKRCVRGIELCVCVWTTWLCLGFNKWGGAALRRVLLLLPPRRSI